MHDINACQILAIHRKPGTRHCSQTEGASAYLGDLLGQGLDILLASSATNIFTKLVERQKALKRLVPLRIHAHHHADLDSDKAHWDQLRWTTQVSSENLLETSLANSLGHHMQTQVNACY